MIYEPQKERFHLLNIRTHNKKKESIMEKIGLASDHAGYELKEFVKEYLDKRGIAYKDYGTHSEESCDYPDYAHALARGIENGEVGQGIGICGSGEGMAMTLNKHQAIRAALVWMPEIAHMTRLHNDANVLVMPGRYISTETAAGIMDEFLKTPFEGGRHVCRLEKMPVDK